MSRAIAIQIAAWAAVLGGATYLTSSVTRPSGLLRAIVPGSIVLMMLGVVGLYIVLGGRGGRLRKIGLGLLAVGLILGVIGMAGSAMGVLEPNPIASVINTGEHAGLVFVAAGMMVWGVLAIRTRALGNLSVTPLVIGMLGLPGIVFVLPAEFTALEDSVLPLLFAGSWILLGLALLSSRMASDRQIHPILQ